MDIFLAILLDILEQGLIYGIMALGLYISYKILNFPDLTVDGSFPLGAAVTTLFLMQGANPWLALLAAILAGCLAGLMTGVLHVFLKINELFSGILSMTILYSVNLLIVGRSNQPFFDRDTIFNSLPASLIPSAGRGPDFRVAIVAFVIVIGMKLLLDYFLKTRKGLLLRAAGDNQQVVNAMGIHPGSMKILGLALANGLVALAGAVLAQQQGFFEVSMGTGIMVMGLASVIMGTVLFTRISRLSPTTKVLLGAILYKALVSLAINLGAPASMLNLVRGVLFLLILLSYQFGQKGGQKHA
ncbi:MAG: ABC transporter permease [Clostridiaceae bacterium]|nr:ABC transporter permease [Clostridiaceae bacterium]